MRRTSVAAGLLCAFLAPACGADISIIADREGPVALLRGPIEPGDAAKFTAMKEAADFHRLYLDSPGGSYPEGLALVDAVVAFPPTATIVGNGAKCYSACALVFMAGLAGGGSAGYFVDRKLHHNGKLGFHAPYVSSDGLTSSPQDIANVYRLAVLSLRDLLKKGIVPASLLLDLLEKGPEEAAMVDTVDAAGRWNVDVIGFDTPRITRRMYCTACYNFMSWTHDESAVEKGNICLDDGSTEYGEPSDFRIKEINKDEYYITVLFRMPRDQRYECKIKYDRGSQTFNGNIAIFGQFGSPGTPFDPVADSFEIYPVHFFEPSTLLQSLGTR